MYKEIGNINWSKIPKWYHRCIIYNLSIFFFQITIHILNWTVASSFNSQHHVCGKHTICSKCGKSIVEEELTNHLEKDCPTRMLPMTCRNCGDKMVQSQKEVGACCNFQFHLYQVNIKRTRCIYISLDQLHMPHMQ